MVRRYHEQPKFRQEVDELTNFFPSWYMTSTKLKTPRLANLYDKILDKYEEDVKLCIKHPQVLKQLKHTAGVLSDDGPKVVHQTVSIDKAMQLVQHSLQRDPDPVADAEVADQIGTGEGGSS